MKSMTIRGVRSALVAATLSASLLAQTTTNSPFAHHDQAKAVAAFDPAGQPHLLRAMNLRPELGVDSNYTFQVINANTDSMGGTHVRMQQYYRGLKVVNGQLLSHTDGQAQYLLFTDALKKNINIGIEPAILRDSALATLSRTAGPLPADSPTPDVELVILPIMERIVTATGAPVGADPATPPTRGAALKPAPAPDAVLEIPPETLNALDTTRRVKEYRLAWEIRTGQGVNGGFTSMLYHLDAMTGVILQQRPLEDRANFWGLGNGKYSGNVQFNTIDYNGGFRMYDSHRNYYTEDDDRSSNDPVNKDADNTWGDGQDFAGDANASVANRQTAMVDGMFGSRVYWEMMSNVFDRQGPNDKYYDVNVFVHVGTNWNDAYYSNGSGNISLGDGKTRTALDCLGHENGHGLNDFTANLGGSGENGGLNESNSDIWGAMTTFYLKGGAYANQGKYIPASGGQWVSVCSGRNMQKPSAAKQHDFWWSTIDSADEHDAAAPNNRAFYFLSQGASWSLKDPDNSILVPWGFPGVGTNKAAAIWYDAFVNWLPGGADYADTRTAVLQAATQKYGAASAEVAAVKNAYAAINVGPPAAGAPPLPPTISEAEPNDTWIAPQYIQFPANPSKPFGGPDKLRVIGGGSTMDWYMIDVKAGQYVSARIESNGTTDYDLKLFDTNMQLLSSSINPAGFADLVSGQAGTGIDPNAPQTFYVQVIPFTPGAANVYRLHLERTQIPMILYF
jgi:Zn-dependent metalloprotease